MKPVRGQVNFETEAAYQQINPSGSNRFFVGSGTKPPNVPHVMYNTRSQNMGGVFLDSSGHSGIPTSPGTFSGRATWWYGQIDGNQSAGNIGVVMTDPWGPGASILSGGQGIVKVDMDYTLVFTETHVTYNVNAYLGGQLVFRVSGLTRPIPPGGENITPLPFAPVFASSISGTFAIEMDNIDDNDWDEPNAGLTYWIQRGLELEQPLQEFTLTPGEPAVFNNSFQWDFGDNRTDLPEASWDIKITTSGGQPVTTLSGTGRTISASWDTSGLTGPFRLKPKGQNSADGGTPIYAYEIVMRSLAYSPSLGNWAVSATETGPVVLTPYEDVFYEVSTAQGTPEIKILNVKLEPDPPFQNEGDTVELTADIVTVGLDDVSENDIEWWIEVIGPDGQPVGDPLATGNGFEVEATWDGKVDGVLVDDPSAYTMRVIATTGCTGVRARARVRAQQSGCLMAQADAQAKVTRLEILKGSSGSSSDRLALGLMPGSREAALRKEAYKLFATVHRQTEPVYFKASGLTFPEGQAPPELKLNWKSVTTGRASPQPITLVETPAGSGNYQSAVIDLAEIALSPTNPVLGSGGSILTTYTIGSIFDGFGWIPAFQNSVLSQYPAARVPLARYMVDRFQLPELVKRDGTAPTEMFPEPSTLEPELAAATVSNLQTLGAETFVGELVEQENVPALKVYFKNHYSAGLVMLSLHGDHFTGAMEALDSEFRSFPRDPDPNDPPPATPLVGGQHFHPSDLQGQYTTNVDTLALVSCDVLDINDFNNYFEWQAMTGQVDANGQEIFTWTLAEARLNPGKKWFDEFISPNLNSRDNTKPVQVLLGYNGPAPIQAISAVMEEYGRQLAVFGNAKNARQLAWVTANLIVGQDPSKGTPIVSPAELALQACAIDKDHYYYIPFEYDYARKADKYIPPKPKTQVGVHWVKRSDWGKTPQNWDRNFWPVTRKNGLGIAEKASVLR